MWNSGLTKTRSEGHSPLKGYNRGVQGPGGGVLHNFQYGEVHANIWGPKFYVESIFGVCELQHGQKFNILGP